MMTVPLAPLNPTHCEVTISASLLKHILFTRSKVFLENFLLQISQYLHVKLLSHILNAEFESVKGII